VGYALLCTASLGTEGALGQGERAVRALTLFLACHRDRDFFARDTWRGTMTDDPTTNFDGPRPTTPPGWYPDPQSTVQTRWWDGQRWTENIQPIVAQAPVQAAKTPVHFTSMPLVKRVRLWGWIVAGIVGALGLVVAANQLATEGVVVACYDVVLFTFFAFVPLATATRGTRWRWWGNLGWSFALAFGGWSILILIYSRGLFLPPAPLIGIMAAGLALGVTSEVLARRRAED